jgi:hypothetical protein
MPPLDGTQHDPPQQHGAASAREEKQNGFT